MYVCTYYLHKYVWVFIHTYLLSMYVHTYVGICTYMYLMEVCLKMNVPMYVVI